jgi:hypothetical protein
MGKPVGHGTFLFDLYSRPAVPPGELLKAFVSERTQEELALNGFQKA